MSNVKKDGKLVAPLSSKHVRVLLLVASFFGINIIGAGTGGCAGKEEFRKTIPVEPGTVLKIFNKNGDIEIAAWERDEVEVYAEKHSSILSSFVKEPDIDISTGREVVIRTIYSSPACESYRIQYRVKVPKGVLVTEVETSRGNITVENVSGDVDAKTSAGQIRIHKVNGFVKAVTDAGKINVDGVAGLSEARNKNGDVTVEVPAIRNDVEIGSSRGDINVSFAAGLAAQLEASTHNGNITYKDLPLTVNESAKKKIAGKLGDGGKYKININTSNGSITLKKL